MNHILEHFPHIVNRIVKFDNEQEELEFIITYGDNAVLLDFVPHKDAKYQTYKGGVVFQLVNINSLIGVTGKSLDYALSSCNADSTRMNDLIGTIVLKPKSYGDFRNEDYNDKLVPPLYTPKDVSNSYSSYKEFNNFWMLRSYSPGYKDIVKWEFPALDGRKVPLTEDRLDELRLIYGDNFYVIDVEVPEDSHCYRIPEGIIFWSYPTGLIRRYEKQFYLQLNSLVSFRPNSKNIPPKFLNLDSGRFGDFKYDANRDYYCMDRTIRNNPKGYLAFWEKHR